MKKAALMLLLFAVPLLTACGSMRPHLSFGDSPVGAIACPMVKAMANMTIAQSDLCKSTAPLAVTGCLTAQAAADATILAACGPAVTPIPVAGREATEALTAAVPADPRAALQRIFESVGMSPAEAAKKAAGVPKP